MVVDARPGSPTFGQHEVFALNDETLWHLYIPAGFLHGFQALSPIADVCYRIDRPHDPSEDIVVRYDDPALGISWPLMVSQVSTRDANAPSWQEVAQRLCA